MLRRSVFFRDEIEHYKDTATSLINKFLESRADILNFTSIRKALEILCEYIMQETNLEKISKRIIKSNFSQSVLDEAKLAFIPELANEEYRTSFLKTLESNLNESTHLHHLLLSLNNLVDAVKNKSVYLEKYSKEIDMLEENDTERYWGNNTRLLLAIEHNDIDLACHLIRKNLFINEANRCGDTPLILAAKLGLDIIVTELLQKPVDINQSSCYDRSFYTALFAAITHKHQSTATLLIQHGAKTDFDIGKYFNVKKENYTLAHYAAEKGIDLSAPRLVKTPFSKLN